MTVRVMVFGTLRRAEDRENFEEAISSVSNTIKGTTGYIRDELLRDPSDPTAYIMMSEWESRDAFLHWEQSSIHKQNTSPLRAYWTAASQFNVYEVITV